MHRQYICNDHQDLTRRDLFLGSDSASSPSSRLGLPIKMGWVPSLCAKTPTNVSTVHLQLRRRFLFQSEPAPVIHPSFPPSLLDKTSCAKFVVKPPTRSSCFPSAGASERPWTPGSLVLDRGSWSWQEVPGEERMERP